MHYESSTWKCEVRLGRIRLEERRDQMKTVIRFVVPGLLIEDVESYFPPLIGDRVLIKYGYAEERLTVESRTWVLDKECITLEIRFKEART